MNGPDTDASEQGTSGKGRVRPGLKGLSWKVLLLFGLVGLSPIGALLAYFWPMVEKSTGLRQQLAEELSRLHQNAASLTRSVESLRQEAWKQTESVHFLSAQRGLHNLATQLIPAVSGEKKPEDILKDPAVLTAIQPPPGPFSEVVLLNASSRRVLLTGSKKAADQLEKTFPDLASRWAPGKAAPTLSAPGWYWLPIGASAYLLAVQVEAPRQAAASQTSAAELAQLATQIESLNSFNRHFFRQALFLAVGLPILALVIAWVAFLGLKIELLAPLRRITRGAQGLVNAPKEVNEEVFTKAGAVEDLAATLTRLLQRMVRLEHLDQLSAQRLQQIHRIGEFLGQTAGGNFGIRIEVTEGEHHQLALMINRLLDTVAERFEALRQATTHLKASADRLNQISGELQKTVTLPATDKPWTDLAPLAEILGVQIAGLCRSASEAVESPTQDAPRPWKPDDREELESSLSSAAANLRLLTKRARQAKGASDRVETLHQDAEVLSANLASATQGHSWENLPKLVDDALALSRTVIDLSASLAKDLDHIVHSADELKEYLRRATDQGANCAELLVSWEHFREAFQDKRNDLSRQIEVMHPAIKSLGGDVRRLFAELATSRKLLTEKQQSFRGVSESSAALGQAAEEILNILDGVDTLRPAPAALTRGLVEKQQLLEQAIRDLTDLASKEGIESLTPDANAILEQVLSAAEEARKRILTGRDGKKPAT